MVYAKSNRSEFATPSPHYRVRPARHLPFATPRFEDSSQSQLRNMYDGQTHRQNEPDAANGPTDST